MVKPRLLISALAPGVYFVRGQGGEDSSVRKIVIVR